MKFSTVLFIDRFTFMLCQSVLRAIPETLSRQIQRNSTFILFADDFVEETAGKDLTAVLKHNERLHPNGQFLILSETNTKDILSEWPDVLLEAEELPQTSCDPALFPEHADNLEYLHRTGQAIRGTLVVSHITPEEGEVLGAGERIKVSGPAMNRALHGDEVYVSNNRVVGISKFKQRKVVGTVYDLQPMKGGVYAARVRAIDRRLPDVIALTKEPAVLNKKVLLYITGWKATHKLPRGVIHEIIGQSAEMEPELRAVLEHFSVDYYDTPWQSVLSTPESCADNPLFSIETAYQDLKNGLREDLRGLTVCSIDPQGCTDIDDALHCEYRDGYIEVGVHIADVSLYVHEGSVLDKVARDRSTTVYLPDRRLDMLPPFLSSGLCSLLPLQDRACISCVWKLSMDFRILDTRIFRSVVRSRAALSYEQAHEMIQNDQGGLADSLRVLLSIAESLRAKRFEKGALKLNAGEGSSGSAHLPTHFLVEEFMLLANISIAEFIFAHNPEYSLLRRHPLPAPIDLDILDCTSSKTINDSLALLSPEQAVIAKRIITRSMQQAVYFVSGENADFYHYGLASHIYTHFTSPIRRYPDLVVHRILVRIFSHDTSAIDSLMDVVTSQSCSFMNFRHRNAQNISRMVHELYLYGTLHEDPVDATVIVCKDGGCAVFVQEYCIEGFVETSREYKVFDSIKVRVEKDFERYCIDRKVILLECVN